MEPTVYSQLRTVSHARQQTQIHLDQCRGEHLDSVTDALSAALTALELLEEALLARKRVLDIEDERARGRNLADIKALLYAGPEAS